MAMGGSLHWASQAAWANKVLLATNPSYRSQLLVICVFYSFDLGKLHRSVLLLRCCPRASLGGVNAACDLQSQPSPAEL